MANRWTKDTSDSKPALKLGKEAPTPPERCHVTTTRIVRDTDKSRSVKQIYDYTCQICGTRLDTPAGPYADGAHIKPLGIPHSGPDIESNILCLCPNHHVLFDDGAITLVDDLTVIGLIPRKKLAIKHQVHQVAIEYVRYHREHFGMLVESHP